MLVGIDTGYEGKFDFPPRSGPPETAYMLATVPRTGSTFVSHLLWRTGCLGAPLEYLNFDPNGHYFFASSSPSTQQQLWRSVLRRRTSPNGVFGLKCFPTQLQLLEETNPPLLSEVLSTVLTGRRPARIIHLARRDRTAHAISLARAMLSGIWRAEQESEGGVDVDYSERAVERAIGMIDAQGAAWEEMFRELRVEPLRLLYEDVLADSEAAVSQVADYLGVQLDPGARVQVPEIRKQKAGDSADWASRYAQSRSG